MSWYRLLPNGEVMNGILYRHIGNDRYEAVGQPFHYKNYSTTEKGIARGEEEFRVQVAGGIKSVKREHKIISSSPIEFQVNDKVILTEENHTYIIHKLERMVNSPYVLGYVATQNEKLVPKAIYLS